MRCPLGTPSRICLWRRKCGDGRLARLPGGDARHYMCIVELRNDEPTAFFWGGNYGLLLGKLLEEKIHKGAGFWPARRPGQRHSHQKNQSAQNFRILKTTVDGVLLFG